MNDLNATKYEKILPGFHRGLPAEFYKLAQLIELDQFELLEEGFRLVYLMNDAVESFLVFENARMTGTYHPDYEGEIRGFLEEGKDGYVLILHQGASVFTLFFESLSLEVHLYNYGETGHFWVKGYEYLRQIEYKIAILRDKYEYLGEEYCNDLEKKLVSLAQFPPLNYCCYSAVSPKYISAKEEKWSVSPEAVDVMKNLAREAGDLKILRLLERYQKTPDRGRAKKLARLMHRNCHEALIDHLIEELIQGASTYENRSFGTEEPGFQKALERAKKRKQELEKIGKQALVFREEPFVYARDSVGFTAYVMIWDKGFINRKVHLEAYSAEE